MFLNMVRLSSASSRLRFLIKRRLRMGVSGAVALADSEVEVIEQLDARPANLK
jgi:hypothetical protein